MSLHCFKDVFQRRAVDVFCAARKSAMFQCFLDHLLMDDLDTLKGQSPHNVFPSFGRIRCFDVPDAMVHRNDPHGVLMMS